jgi:hypothetical protein
MISRKIKLLVAAVSLVALATTVGFAGTMHIHARSAQQKTLDSGGTTVKSPLGQNASPRRGILTCGSVSTSTACEQLEMLLPMSGKGGANPLKLPTDI